MIQSKHKAPSFRSKGFTCPHCDTYAAMQWFDMHGGTTNVLISVAVCHKCSGYTTWKAKTPGQWKLIDPLTRLAQLPSEDLPTNCKTIYLEARDIAESSPRGAAALLRLCIQLLCVHLGGKGRNINDDIGELVRNGLPVKIQQALDAVRVIGNNAVHPGEISVDDERDTVYALFSLINMIVDHQITQPKQVAELFDSLPEGARQAVQRRDGTA